MVLVLRLKKKDLMSGFSKDFKELQRSTTTTPQTKLCNHLNGEMNRAARAAPIVVLYSIPQNSNLKLGSLRNDT